MNPYLEKALNELNPEYMNNFLYGHFHEKIQKLKQAETYSRFNKRYEEIQSDIVGAEIFLEEKGYDRKFFGNSRFLELKCDLLIMHTKKHCEMWNECRESEMKARRDERKSRRKQFFKNILQKLNI